MNRLGAEHTRAQHRVNVLRVRTDDRDEPACPRDAGACQQLFVARIALQCQRAICRRLIDSRAVSVHHDERHRPPQQLLRDDAADAAVPAQDEVVVK
jgi:hypothetical protein